MANNNSSEKPKKIRVSVPPKRGADAAGAESERSAAMRAAAGRASEGGNGGRRVAGAKNRASAPPTSDEIAIRAFDIWEKQGRPEG
jgi:hypothetical protein